MSFVFHYPMSLVCVSPSHKEPKWRVIYEFFWGQPNVAERLAWVWTTSLVFQRSIRDWPTNHSKASRRLMCLKNFSIKKKKFLKEKCIQQTNHSLKDLNQSTWFNAYCPNIVFWRASHLHLSESCLTLLERLRECKWEKDENSTIHFVLLHSQLNVVNFLYSLPHK